MDVRTVLARLGTATAAVVGALGIVALGAGDADAKPSTHYVVRVDPRLCPSPLCGGYWVSLANRSRTRCHDGLHRPRCYVASAWPASRAIHDGALVQGGISVQSFPGFGGLGLFIATDVRNPLGPAPSGSFFRLRDIGVRCVREPCFSIRAFRLNGRSTTMVSGLDLSRIGLPPEHDARLALFGDGLFAAGRIVSTHDGGRVFRAARIYVRGSKSRV
jgi:hypothetical protein